MDKRTAESILTRAAALNVQAAEVFLRTSSSSSIEVKDQKVDAFDSAQDRGAGLRVLIDGRQGFAFTTDIADRSLEVLAQSAVTNALNTERDPFFSIPGKPAVPYEHVQMYDPAMARLSEDAKIERVMSMEREAFALDPRIKRIRKASAGFSESETLIMNTNGVEVSYQGTACSSSIEVVAEENGESQSGSEFDVTRYYGRLEVEEVARKAARKAIDLLGARRIDSVKAPAVLEATVAQEFLSILASGFSAESVQKKRSLFMGKLGRKVAATAITVTDDGLLQGGLGTAPADDEAVPMQKKVIITNGTLSLFLHNTYTAAKEKTSSTGNGLRGGFKGIPGVGITNLSIEPGLSSLDELIRQAGRGFLVTDVMGMHTANPISGDFSVGATGFWFENGRKAYPVREATIAGNILDVMSNVVLVGSDLRFSGRIGSPSLLIKELSIGGK